MGNLDKIIKHATESWQKIKPKDLDKFFETENHRVTMMNQNIKIIFSLWTLFCLAMVIASIALLIWISNKSINRFSISWHDIKLEGGNNTTQINEVLTNPD